MKSRSVQTSLTRDFPHVHWLRLHLPMKGVHIWSLVRELRSHMPCGQKTKKKKKNHKKPTSNIVTNSIKIFFNEKWKSLSHVWCFVTPWTITCQAPPSMEFSRQEYWNGLPFPSPGDLPNPEIEPRSPSIAGRVFTIQATKESTSKILFKKAYWNFKVLARIQNNCYHSDTTGVNLKCYSHSRNQFDSFPWN